MQGGNWIEPTLNKSNNQVGSGQAAAVTGAVQTSVWRRLSYRHGVQDEARPAGALCRSQPPSRPAQWPGHCSLAQLVCAVASSLCCRLTAVTSLRLWPTHSLAPTRAQSAMLSPLQRRLGAWTLHSAASRSALAVNSQLLRASPAALAAAPRASPVPLRAATVRCASTTAAGADSDISTAPIRVVIRRDSKFAKVSAKERQQPAGATINHRHTRSS